MTVRWNVPAKRERGRTISASEARKHLQGGDAVLMSADDYDSWQETIYLLRSPANAQRLMAAIARDRAGEAAVVKEIDELRDMAGGGVRGPGQAGRLSGGGGI